MPATEVKALMRRWYEECNNGKKAFMAVFDELHTADIVFHGGGGEEIRGLKSFKKYCREMFGVFPDLHYVINDMVVEGDKVAVRTTWTCTYKGEGKGVPPTSKKVRAWEIEIDRVVDGKIAEVWNRYDTLGLMQQIGLAAMPETKTTTSS